MNGTAGHMQAETGGAAAETAEASGHVPLNLPPARYTRWFRGESPVIRKLRAITPDMTPAEVAAVTRENLALIGEETGNQFTSNLPAGHKMKKTVRSSVMRGAPHLGTCRFGDIVTNYDDGRYSMIQLFLANFAGKIDTSDSNAFLTPLSRDYDQMYFGLHVFMDRAGNSLGFNHAQGAQGIAFQTRDMMKAFQHAAAASTGISLSELKARMAPKTRR